MATATSPIPLTLDQLLEAIERLSPAERRELRRQVLAWPMADEAELRRAAKASLPAAEQRRLRRRIARSERGTLTPEELAEYRLLARRAEQVDGTRAAALAELSQRRGPKQCGTEGTADGA